MEKPYLKQTISVPTMHHIMLQIKIDGQLLSVAQNGIFLQKTSQILQIQNYINQQENQETL